MKVSNCMKGDYTMFNSSKRVIKTITLLLLLCLVCTGIIAQATDSDAIKLTVNLVRIDDLLLHVGEITNPRPNMGIAMFTEIFEGLWLKVVTGSEELEVLSLDESGQFARIAYFADSQNEGRVLVPVKYVILDLDNVPEELSLENAEAAALCVFRVVPEERAYDVAFQSAQDGRTMYPEIDALLEKQAAY